MDGFKSIQMFLILMIPFTASVTQHRPSITVRVGDEATLSCEDVKEVHDECYSTTWLFSDSTNTVTLFEYRKVHREAAAKSDRLRVTEKCSLVIKKVTVEDAGRYICRQFTSGQPYTDSLVDLSVINREDTPKRRRPPPTTTTTTKATTTTTITSTKATTRSTTTQPPPPPKTTTTTTTTAAKVNTTSEQKATNPGSQMVTIPVAVVLAALLITVVAVIRWKRAKGNNSQEDDNTADPPDGVSYASIHYKKKTDSKAGVLGKGHREDTVTYSTLSTPSTSAGASTDPRNLYASVNKTNT